MKLTLVESSKPDSAPIVIQLPVEDSDRRERLALRIADSVSAMGLNVFETNACARIGLACMDQGLTLLGAHDHAVKVARRILLVKSYTERVLGNNREAGHD